MISECRSIFTRRLKKSLVNKDAFSKLYLSYGLIKDSCLIRRVLQGVIPCYEMMRLVKKVLPAICYYLLKRLKIRLNLIKNQHLVLCARSSAAEWGLKSPVTVSSTLTRVLFIKALTAIMFSFEQGTENPPSEICFQTFCALFIIYLKRSERYATIFKERIE